MMSVAPRSLSAGIKMLISDFGTTVSIAKPPPPDSSETVGDRSDGSTSTTASSWSAATLSLTQHLSSGLERALEQR